MGEDRWYLREHRLPQLYDAAQRGDLPLFPLLRRYEGAAVEIDLVFFHDSF